MPTSRFVRLVGVPERTYRRWQSRQRQVQPTRGPWPAPARDLVEPAAVAYADRWPACGHRKIAALIRADGHEAPDSTVLRALRRTGRVLPVDYQAERRQLAQARWAAFGYEQFACIGRAVASARLELSRPMPFSDAGPRRAESMYVHPHLDEGDRRT